jgi:hypothetical protein
MQRLFHDPPLLLYRTPFSLRLSLNNCSLRSVHVALKWALPYVPTRAIIPDFAHSSQTVGTERLRSKRG